MKKIIVQHATIFILFCVVATSWAQQAVPEQALRHMARGDAAVEMAKTPEDYETVIKEFQEAARLAPYWADPYYKLGLVQEKAGKFREAASSLNRYLQLAPNAPDTPKIKELIYRLEFKAEQVITDDEVLDIFASLKDSSKWRLKAITNASLLDSSFEYIRWLKRDRDRIHFEFFVGVEKYCIKGFCPISALPTGKTIEFRTHLIRDPDDSGYTSFHYFRLEVVSRNKVTMTIERARYGAGVGSYEFIRR